MNIRYMHLSLYVSRLVHRQHFSFARYGDGEWHAMLGDKGENCDGNLYYPEMGAELRASLNTPYYHATIPAVKEVGMDRVHAYLDEHGMSDKQWEDGNVFRNALLKGGLRDIRRGLIHRKSVYVGPRFLRDFVLGTLGVDMFVVVPEHNCYVAKDRIINHVKAAIETVSAEIVGFSSGMATKVMIAELYPKYKRRLSMIDFGSVFDPFPKNGRLSRKYMRDMDVELLRSRNFSG